MIEYSFEKYMDNAIRSEYAMDGEEADTQQLLLEVPGFPVGDLTLEEEARLVASALSRADIDLDKMVVDPLAFDPDDPATAKAGWDIGAFTPNPKYGSVAINGEIKNRTIVNESILLDENGTLYFCWLNIDPHQPLRRSGSWQAEKVGEIYNPDKTLEEYEERIRYGLARLVAKYELELPD